MARNHFSLHPENFWNDLLHSSLRQNSTPCNAAEFTQDAFANSSPHRNYLPNEPSPLFELKQTIATTSIKPVDTQLGMISTSNRGQRHLTCHDRKDNNSVSMFFYSEILLISNSKIRICSRISSNEILSP